MGSDEAETELRGALLATVLAYVAAAASLLAVLSLPDMLSSDVDELLNAAILKAMEANNKLLAFHRDQALKCTE